MSKEEKNDIPKAKKSRDKKFVKVEGYLDLLSSLKFRIKLKVVATPKDWETLKYYLQNVFSYERHLVLYEEEDPEIIGTSRQQLREDEDQFLSEIYAFTDAALEALKKKKPRGKHKRTLELVSEIKDKAGWLYPFLKYWCKKSIDSWPDPFKCIIKIAENEGVEDFLEMKGKYDPVVITAYCIEKVHGKEAKKLGLKPFFEFEERESIENFYFTYIQAKKLPQFVHKSLIAGKEPKEVEMIFNLLLKGETIKIDTTIYYLFPPKDIFESLGII